MRRNTYTSGLKYHRPFVHVYKNSEGECVGTGAEDDKGLGRREFIKLGAGISAKVGDYLELRADLDTRQGSDYSDHTLLGSLRYQF